MMKMYNSIEHNDNYSKTSGSLWQQYRAETAVKHKIMTLLKIFLVTVLRLNLRLKLQERPLLMVEQKMFK